MVVEICLRVVQTQTLARIQLLLALSVQVATHYFKVSASLIVSQDISEMTPAVAIIAPIQGARHVTSVEDAKDVSLGMSTYKTHIKLNA